MKVNIFIDGSWLFKACAPGKVLSNRMVYYSNAFEIDFQKMNESILAYIHSVDGQVDSLGHLFLVTSIFNVPADADTWLTYQTRIPSDFFQRLRGNIAARNAFVQSARDAGYTHDEVVFRPDFKPYMIKKFQEGKLREKEVDATVVALLVKCAIIESGNYHVIISGDTDMLPAIRVAYPEYSRNVVLVTSHPDELDAQNRQSAYSLSNFAFKVPPYYFQDHIGEIMKGNFIYRCDHCAKYFTTRAEIKGVHRPYCKICRPS